MAHTRGSGAAGQSLTANTWTEVFNYATDGAGYATSFAARVRDDSTATQVLLYVEGLHGAGAPTANTQGVPIYQGEGWCPPLSVGATGSGSMSKVYAYAVTNAGKIDCGVFDDLGKIV